MSLLVPTDRAALEKDPEKAGQAMESMLLQKMLASCHLMGKSKAPGASMHADMFAESLADAVTQHGGLGLAKQFAGSPTAQATTAEVAQSISREASKNLLVPKPSGTGTDLETDLLTHKLSLIESGKRADKDLGEP